MNEFYSGEFDCTDCGNPCELLEWQMIGLREDPRPECKCCPACEARRLNTARLVANLIRATQAVVAADPAPFRAAITPMCDGSDPINTLQNVTDCCGESSGTWVRLTPPYLPLFGGKS